MVTARASFASTVGLIRNLNEDAHGIGGLNPECGDGSVRSEMVTADFLIAVVADGLGGHPCGDVASRLAVQSVLSAMPTNAIELRNAIEAANSEMYVAMASRPGCSRMGSTIAVVLMNNKELILANVGDSAIFDFSHERLELLSTPDVEGDAGPGLPGLPRARITRALGGRAEFTDVELNVCVRPRSGSQRVLLCTDGLTDYVPVTKIGDILRGAEGSEAVAALLGAVFDAGAPDNMTVQLIETVDA